MVRLEEETRGGEEVTRIRTLRILTAAAYPAIASGWSAAAAAQEAGPMARLPADPPIGGLIWTVIIPAALLVGSFLATYLLYRRFSKDEG